MGFFDGISNWFQSAGKSIGSTFNNVHRTLGNVANSVGTWIGQNAKPLLNGAKTVVNGLQTAADWATPFAAGIAPEVLPFLEAGKKSLSYANGLIDDGLNVYDKAQDMRNAIERRQPTEIFEKGKDLYNSGKKFLNLNVRQNNVPAPMSNNRSKMFY